MSNRHLCLLVALVACRHRAPDSFGVDLPEAEDARETAAPADILTEAANGDDPGLRARAIRDLVATDPVPAGGAWGARGLYDPDGWVERAAVGALAQRLDEPETVNLLVGWLSWADGDPHARASAGLQLVDAGVGRDAVVAAWRAEAGWRAVPLALAAAVAGDADALASLATALRTGLIPLEPDFLRELGERPLPGLADAARAGADRVEEPIRLTYAGTRLALGDTSADGELRRALDDTESAALEALDAVAMVPGPLADNVIRRARTTGPDLVRGYADLLDVARTGVGSDAFARAAASDDRELRAMAVRLLPAAAQASAAGRRGRWIDRALAAALADPDPTVRAGGVRAAVELERRDLRELVAPLLGDPNRTVRVEAAGAITRWSGSTAAGG